MRKSSISMFNWWNFIVISIIFELCNAFFVYNTTKHIVASPIRLLFPSLQPIAPFPHRWFVLCSFNRIYRSRSPIHAHFTYCYFDRDKLFSLRIPCRILLEARYIWRRIHNRISAYENRIDICLSPHCCYCHSRNLCWWRSSCVQMIWLCDRFCVPSCQTHDSRWWHCRCFANHFCVQRSAAESIPSNWC